MPAAALPLLVVINAARLAATALRVGSAVVVSNEVSKALPDEQFKGFEKNRKEVSTEKVSSVQSCINKGVPMLSSAEIDKRLEEIFIRDGKIKEEEDKLDKDEKEHKNEVDTVYDRDPSANNRQRGSEIENARKKLKEEKGNLKKENDELIKQRTKKRQEQDEVNQKKQNQKKETQAQEKQTQKEQEAEKIKQVNWKNRPEEQRAKAAHLEKERIVKERKLTEQVEEKFGRKLKDIGFEK